MLGTSIIDTTFVSCLITTTKTTTRNVNSDDSDLPLYLHINTSTSHNGVHTNGATTNGVVHPSTLKKHIDGFATRAIHVGSEPNAETGAVIPPISLSTTYEQEAIGVHKRYLVSDLLLFYVSISMLVVPRDGPLVVHSRLPSLAVLLATTLLRHIFFLSFVGKLPVILSMLVEPSNETPTAILRRGMQSTADCQTSSGTVPLAGLLRLVVFPAALRAVFGSKARHDIVNLSYVLCRTICVVSHLSPQLTLCYPQGYEYSRSGNPNRNLLERTLASLESSPAQSNVALAFSSGSSTTSAVLSALGPNAHIVSVNDVYGGTFRYISRVASTLQGLQSTFLDLENASDDEILGALRENTKLVWIESPTNPTLRVVDVPRISAIIERGWREGKTTERPIVLVDNTFLSPYYASPLLQGADVVLHSLTKYVNGHSDVVMGALILPEPTSSNQPELADKLRFLQNAMGAVPSPFDCFLAQRGAKTLALRMKTHGLNALAVARTLQSLADSGEGVDEVVYPGLPGRTEESRRKNKLAWRMLSPHARRWISDSVYPGRGLEASDEPPAAGFPFSGMISVRVSTPPTLAANSTGTAQFQTANTFLTSLRLFTLAESLGGVESLAEHPAAMTHGSIPPAERELLGIGENLVRLSVGVEEEADLVADVRAAVGRSWAPAVEAKEMAAPIACGRDGMCREFEY
ncbi:hypothetical protein D9619_011156 [Psilocybe cf. subviscida]|uniref:cystathionine gamma-lyase n=1 Tax=Psilocybe cf. subviscida TaxID=2480587 RepID=A0A8H5BIV4_9AGAR|nr:hypothetical protein D9619_011156 [Psilocybe cf. subviscida]